MNISKKLIYMCAAVLTAVLSVGCSQSNNDDDPDDPGFEQGVPTEVRITLSSRSANGTRADGGTPKDPNEEIEKIHNWWIAFVDANGNVSVQTRNSTSDDGFEVETFNCIIPSGTYDIYAFANIDYSDTNLSTFVNSLATARKNATSKDAAITTIKEAMTKIPLNSTFEPDNMTWSKSKNIPMTGYILGAQVRNTIEEAFSIEVIRAVAKVEFTFTNPTEDVITLKDLSFGPITKTDVSLFPQYSVLGLTAYSPFGTADYGFPSVELKDLTADENPQLDYKTLVKDTPWSYYFYCKESLAPSVTATETTNEPAKTKDLFTITLTVNKNNSATDEPKRTFYTSLVKEYINRNDWIHIPIKFNEWTIYWKLHYYPPIGGYPPVFEQDANGTSMKATLTTGGEFELYPYMIKQNNDETNYFDKVDWDHSGMSVELVSGTDNLFVGDKVPTIEPNPNISDHPLGDKDGVFPKIIMGELDPKKTGKAELKIIFYLKDTPVSGTKLVCTFTIDRKNSSPGQ